MSIRTLEQLLRNTPTEAHPTMRVLPAYTYPTDEGQSVRGMAMGLLSKAGLDGDTAKRVFDALVEMPMGANLPSIVSASRNEKDLIPLVNWFLSGVGRNADATACWHSVERLGDLMRRKFDYETTMNADLTEVQRKYPTLDKLSQWLDAESKDNRNVKLDRGGYNFPELLAYSDDKVDVYKASNPMEAIALSKGYTFCIGLAGGNNMFYTYRNDPPDATAYFAWFKDKEGKKSHDNMCVVHVGSDGRYRMTDSGNRNHSPVVDKARLLSEYPLLKDALNSGKLTADPYTKDEQAVKEYKPLAFVDLTEETKALTPTSIAILIGRGCVFSDDFFDYVWNEVDKGRYKDAGYDSLIRKYVLAGFAVLSEHQKQVLKGAGLGREVTASDVRVRSHWVQEQKALFEQLVKIKAITITETDVYTIEIKQKWERIDLYSPLDKPIVFYNLPATSINFRNNIWNDNNIKNIRFSRTEYIDSLFFLNCNNITKVEFGSEFRSIRIGSLAFEGCGNLQSLRGLSINGIYDRIWISDCNSIQTLEGLEDIGYPEYVSIRRCAKFRSLRGLSDISTYNDNRDINFRLVSLPSYTTVDYLPKNINPSGFEIKNCPVKSIEGAEWVLDKVLSHQQGSVFYIELAKQLIKAVIDTYSWKYDAMKRDIPSKMLNKMQKVMRSDRLIHADAIKADSNGILHFNQDIPALQINGTPIETVPIIKKDGHNYLDMVVDSDAETDTFMLKLDYFPIKITKSLYYKNQSCSDLRGITPDINTLYIGLGTEKGLTSFKGIKKVDYLIIQPEYIFASCIASLINEPVNIHTILFNHNAAFDEHEDVLKAMMAFKEKHPATVFKDSHFHPINIKKCLASFVKSVQDTTTESLNPCYTLMRTLNAVSEGWLDKVSGFLDKVDPDRSKMRGLAKTALALAGGGELDDLVGLIKDRSTDADVDDERATDILREVSLILGKTDAEVNQFTRLPEKERTEMVKKALQDVIYRKYKMNRSEGRAMERVLYRRIKDALWNKYKCTLGESKTHKANARNESLSKPSQSPDWYKHTTHHIKVAQRANTGVSEGLPPTVNFEGEVMELTTTESDAVDTIVANVQRLIERDLSEQDLESPEFKKELAKMCMRFANSDKRTAKKAFIKILKNFIQK